MESVSKVKVSMHWASKDAMSRHSHSDYESVGDTGSPSGPLFDRVRNSAPCPSPPSHHFHSPSRLANTAGARPRPATVLSARFVDAPLRIPDDLPFDLTRKVR